MTNQMPALVHVMAQIVRPQPGHRLIFTFDELMNPDRIGGLCPEPRFVTTARYLSRQFTINSDGVATARPQRGHVLHGVVWEVSEIGLTALDIAMGVPSLYDRFGAFARGPGEELITTEFYASRDMRSLGTAKPSYLNVILDAARHWQFPEPYLDEVAAWSEPERRGATSQRGAR